MKNNIKLFNEYKKIYYFINNEKLKSWINENNFINIFEEDWNVLMPCIAKISNNCEDPEEIDNLKYAILSNDIETAYKFIINYI